jgi:hypothetical protein
MVVMVILLSYLTSYWACDDFESIITLSDFHTDLREYEGEPNSSSLCPNHQFNRFG